eukprot:CAMPEP_0114361884 /NCGR_PEP_ID=MMETSP0101-20121206/25162_1 /TAXON_ID=38822 ORGANISM="Pteridomonas danica, Strain PT" /NCGR_SAMPLE_ID=MMETSP0101 /ASSEMBLY_ACC=CAM_ASM_000211 /LENGTH=30 /DNA_ID= /DNA_START= /DNA_END= /DNA_ORIENTATION=
MTEQLLETRGNVSPDSYGLSEFGKSAFDTP